ncbi:putative Vacuolar protein sorting-associated protein 13 [Blattamonas nauphoetae]|uniref:Vacuolar protein sorting-associated protein 13 n=1 Tax=Blattamonas nauphoetae TaxID=2049346 RepID=A0ABQ9Y069_9EUKA|nr:putative Vacuolar protein sorting-associated protein 13 [Blattamonas nauphoetae]
MNLQDLIRIFILLFGTIVLFVYYERLITEGSVYEPIPSFDEEYEITPKTFGIEYEDIHLKSADGTDIHGWYLPYSNTAPLVVHTHGNYGNISTRINEICAIYKEIHANIFLYDYRSFGKTAPKESPKHYKIKEDAEAAYAWAKQQIRDGKASELWTYGHSMGGGISIDYVRNHQDDIPTKLLFVENSFSTLREEGEYLTRLGGGIYIPQCVDNEWRNVENIKYITCPTCVVVSEKDSKIPPSQTKSIFTSSLGIRKELIHLTNAVHTVDWQRYAKVVIPEVTRFARSLDTHKEITFDD